MCMNKCVCGVLRRVQVYIYRYMQVRMYMCVYRYVCVQVCLCGVCTYVCRFMCTCLCACVTHVCGDPKLSVLLLNQSPLEFFRQGLPLTLKLTPSAGLADQRKTGTTCPHLAATKTVLMRCCVCFW